MTKQTIKLLDLCCKAGGCSMGYYKAAIDLGFSIEITGVDHKPQPNYPFNFIQADAVDYLKNNHYSYTHFHASPLCQKWSQSTAPHRETHEYPDIIEPIRNLFLKIGKPAVIENVPNAPVRPDVVLRGDMFGLKVLRKRHFELINWFMLNPYMPKKKGTVKDGDYCSVFGKGAYRKTKGNEMPKFKKNSVAETWSFAMGIDWPMKDVELAEAIPPAYTKYIGLRLFKII